MPLACFIGLHHKSICKILYNDVFKKDFVQFVYAATATSDNLHTLPKPSLVLIPLPFILQFLSESTEQRLPFLLCFQQLFKQNTKSLGNHLRNKDLTIGF